MPEGQGHEGRRQVAWKKGIYDGPLLTMGSVFQPGPIGVPHPFLRCECAPEGITGHYCELRGEVFCPGQCSLRGECISGFCK